MKTRKEWRVYNRGMQRKYRAEKRKEYLLSKGRCPSCMILLNPEYDKFHTDCSFWENIHDKIAFYQENVLNKLYG